MAGSTFSYRPTARSAQSFSSSIASRDKEKNKTNLRPLNPQTTLAKRLLFPHIPPGTDLPPLLSSKSLPSELHAELYDFIALALRAYINPWWTKITRYDKELLIQINSVLTDVLRSLEARISTTDLSPLILRDIPTLITQHYDDYRLAALKLNTSYSVGGAASFSQLFHQFQPHMAISPHGQINEDYMRQSVDFILKACLPPKDYAPDTERYIIREIVLKVILGIIPRLSQPWFIHKLALDIMGSTEEQTEPPKESCRKQQSFSVIAIFILSTIQSLSGFCLALIHGYKHALQTIKQINSAPGPRTTPENKRLSSKSLNVRPSMNESYSSDSIPPSSSSSPAPSLVTPSISPNPSEDVPPSPVHAPPNYNNSYAQPLVKLVSVIFGLQNRFASSATLSTVEMLTSASSPFLDKLLPYMLYKHAISPPRVIDIVKISKKALFPNGYLAPQPVDPTAEEQAELRERLVRKIDEMVPWWLSPILLGPKTKRETIAGILQPLSSPDCNAHLILFILDTVLIQVIPELGDLTDVNSMEPNVLGVREEGKGEVAGGVRKTHNASKRPVSMSGVGL